MGPVGLPGDSGYPPPPDYSTNLQEMVRSIMTVNIKLSLLSNYYLFFFEQIMVYEADIIVLIKL